MAVPAYMQVVARADLLVDKAPAWIDLLIAVALARPDPSIDKVLAWADLLADKAPVWVDMVMLAHYLYLRAWSLPPELLTSLLLWSHYFVL